MLSGIDFIIIATYFLVVLIVGLRAGVGETREGFLIADRNLGALPTALTIVASKVGGGILLTYTALVYLFGFSGIWFFIGAIVGYFFFYFFSKYIKTLADEKKYYTLPDFFFDRFGKVAGYLAGLIVFTTMLGWLIVNLIGGGKILEQFTPLGYEWSVISVGAVILVYVFVGGFKAVVKTDIIQSLGIVLLFILMVYLLVTGNTNLKPADFNLFSIPIVQLISFFLTGVFFPFASAELWQRVYAVKDHRSLKNSLIFTSFFYVAIGIVLTFIGLVVRAALPGLDPDISLINGLVTLLPAGLIGLAVVVFYSAIMSSADTFLFTANTSIVNDLLFRKQTRDKSSLKAERTSMVLVAIFAIALAFLLKNIIDTTFLFAALTMALGLLVMILWIFKRLNKFSIIFTLILNFFGILALAFTVGISTTLVLYSLVLTVVGVIFGVAYKLVLSLKKSRPPYD